MQKEFTVKSPEETYRLASRLGELVKSPYLIFLKGEMGTGKTQFSKAFASGYGSEDDTNSPTFTIINTYESPNGPVNHLDLYRLADIDEFYSAGLEESVNSDSVSLIEWPELLEDDMRPDMIIEILATGEMSRQIKVDTEDINILEALEME